MGKQKIMKKIFLNVEDGVLERMELQVGQMRKV